MGALVTIGLDIAKSIFQVHGVDAAGEVVIRRRLTRRKVPEFFADLPECLVGVEACASAHHWGTTADAGSGFYSPGRLGEDAQPPARHQRGKIEEY